MFLVRKNYQLPAEEQLYDCLAARKELERYRASKPLVTDVVMRLVAMRLSGKSYYLEALKGSVIEAFRDVPLSPRFSVYNSNVLGPQPEKLFNATIEAVIACSKKQHLAAWN